MKRDHAENEDQRQNQDNDGVDLQTGGLVRVQPYKQESRRDIVSKLS